MKGKMSIFLGRTSRLAATLFKLIIIPYYYYYYYFKSPYILNNHDLLEKKFMKMQGSKGEK